MRSMTKTEGHRSSLRSSITKDEANSRTRTKSMDEFKCMTMTSSVFTDQGHGGGPPRELEELSQDGQSAPRLNDTYTAYTLAYNKISTYEAYAEAYDDNAAPCA